MKLILASKSPRRKELLRKFNFDFSCETSDFIEIKGDNPAEICEKNAIGKAYSVFIKHKDDVTVLGSDTVVYFNGKIYGKPTDKNDAIKMLKALSGNTHKVYTGYSIINKNESISGYFVSKVTFNTLSEKIINEYIESGLPLDKAGAYGIQDDFNVVKSIEGSYYNVMGLPIDKIDDLLKEMLNA